MSDCVRQSLVLLEVIAKTKKPALVIKQAINKGGDTLVNAITEIVHNILFGRIRLSNTDKQKLTKVKPILRKLANKEIVGRKRICIRNPDIVQATVRIALPTIKILQ